MTEKKYFKSMLFAVAILFVITCFSLIFCIVNKDMVEPSQNSSHILSIVYMVFQLGMEGIVFYYAFKAMVNGSSLMKVAMYIKDDVVNKKSRRNALIIFIVFIDLAIYFLLTIIFDIFLSFFALGLRFALMNCCALIGIIALYFFCYRRNVEEQ